MGLDMRLGRARKELFELPEDVLFVYKDIVSTYFTNCSDKELMEQLIAIIERKYPILKELDESELSGIQLAYWRNADFLHKWFVDNVQNGQDICGEYVVPKERLEELLDICKKIKENHDLAPELLPIQRRFWPYTIYDKEYLKQIDYTIEVLEKALNETDFDKYVIFYWFWW